MVATRQNMNQRVQPYNRKHKETDRRREHLALLGRMMDVHLAYTMRQPGPILPFEVDVLGAVIFFSRRSGGLVSVANSWSLLRHPGSVVIDDGVSKK
jgi:hypothetical protein